MKMELWLVGKTNEEYLRTGMALFEKRIKRYLPFQVHIFPDLKNTRNLSPLLVKEKEGQQILGKLKKEDHLLLLDERGKTFTSVDFASFIERKMNYSAHRIIFLVGGAYGFSPELYQRANGQIALSAMTFSHQMVRLFFLEQLYRAMTILHNEPYHNP